MPLIRLGNAPLGGGSWDYFQLSTANLPLRLGTSQLGESKSKFVNTITFGRYPFTGGGYNVVDNTLAYMAWSSGTNVIFLPEVNGVVDQFTSKLAYDTILTKIGLSFTLGNGGIVTYTGQTDSPEFDGATDVGITATSIAGLGGGGWLWFNLIGNLTSTYPLGGNINHISTRNPSTAYLNGDNWFLAPALHYAPWNDRHLTDYPTVFDESAVQNQMRTPTGSFYSWAWKVPVVAQYGRILVIDIVSSLSSMSSFSGTLTGTTPSGTVTFGPGFTMSLFSYHRVPAIYLISGSINVAAINMDGATSVAIAGQQVFVTGWTATAATDFTWAGIKSYAATWQGDGATDCRIPDGNIRIVYGSWEGDGATDVQITTIGIFDNSMTMDGATDCSIPDGVLRIVYGPWEGDGATAVTIDPLQTFAGFFNMDGATAVVIDARQIYTSNNTFNMDGVTDVAILAQQGYAASMTMDGVCTFGVVNTVAIYNGTVHADGLTSWTMDTVADYFIHINMDGSASVAINASYYPVVQIVSTGVGDMFVDGRVGFYAGFDADGITSMSVDPRVNFAGELAIFTGLQTNVEFSARRIVNVFMNMDGSTDVHIQVNQDLFGTVVFDQIDQILSALGSFIFTDGSIFPAATTTLTVNGTSYVLGPEYISAIVSNRTDYGVTNFPPMPSDSFTLDGKTSRTYSGLLGVHNYKLAFGFTRSINSFLQQKMQSDIGEEPIRINIFVDNALDFTPIDDTIGFTAAGKTAIGSGVLLGRDLEQYATFSVLTNTRVTQNVLEVLATGDPFVDVTQICYEMLWIPDSQSRVTQVVGEVLYLANLAAIQQTAVETLAGGENSGLLQQAAIEMIHSIKATTFVTAVSIEGIQGPGDPNSNVTQLTMEALSQNQLVQFAAAVVNQVAVEEANNANPNASVAAVAIEELNNADPKARVAAASVETIHNNNRNALVNQIVVEEANNSTTFGGATQQIAIEMLVKSEFDPTASALANNPRYHI